MPTSTRGGASAPKLTPAQARALLRYTKTLPKNQPSARPSAGTKKPLSRDEQLGLAVNRTLDPTHSQLGRDVARSRETAPGPAVSGYSAASAAIGPNLAAKLPGMLTPAGTKPRSTAGGSALDAALLLPILRGPRAAARGLKVLRDSELAANASKAQRAASVTRAAGSSMREVGPVRQAVRSVRQTRTVRLGGQVTQFPNSPSYVTAFGQRLIDRASEHLTGSVEALRASDSRIARGTGQVLTPFSSRARVPKQAGKLIKKEAKRRQAGLVVEAQTIRDVGKHRVNVPFTRSEGVQAAHFWYAQLPPAYRNAEGLRLVRDKLQSELQRHAAEGAGTFVTPTLKRARVRLAALQAAHEKALTKEGDWAKGQTLVEVAAPSPYKQRLAETKTALEQAKSLDAKWVRENGGQLTPGGVKVEGIPRSPNPYRDRIVTLGHTLETLQTQEVRWAEKAAPVKLRASNPHRDRLVQIGHALEKQQARVTALEARAAVRGKKADPEVLKDLATAVQKLDRIVKDAPVHDQRVTDALDALSNDVRGIYVRAGKLDPNVADVRKGLLARWLGLDPTGHEVYMGHRMAHVRGARASGLPGGAGVGKTMLPAGVTKQNQMRLVSTGRVRQSLDPALEDWQAAQAYDFHNIAKDELAKMGEPIVGRPKPGYMVVNPKGHKLPRYWKTDQVGQAQAEGFKPEDVIVHDLTDYLNNYLAEPGPDAQRLIQAATKAGHAADLRQVPQDVVRRYYSQFLPTKIQAATPGVQASTSALGHVGNTLHDALYVSLIYANPGYIPANLAGNLVMAGLQQGAFLPVNLTRAGQLLIDASPKLKHLVLAEVGQGATVAGASSRPMQKVGRVVGAIPDNLPRVSAFIHELARVGVISKVKPVLAKSDYVKIERFLLDPANRPLLNDVSDRAVQAEVDFERQGSMEKAVMGRLGFVWAWTRGATRYPGRFALDHPIRSAALGYTVAGAPGAPQDVQDAVQKHLPTVAGGLPPYMQGALEAGSTTIDKVPYPRVLQTRSYSPTSTPLELYNTLTGRPGANTVGQMLNPSLQAGFNIASKRASSGFTVPTYREAATSNLLRLAPDVGLAKDLLHPSATTASGKPKMYPEDATRAGRLKRALRLFPVAVNPEVAYQARVRAGVVPRAEQLVHVDSKFRTELGAAMRKVGQSSIPPVVKDALDVRLSRKQELASAQDRAGHKLSQRERFSVDVASLVTMKRMTPDEAQKALQWSKAARDRDLDSARAYMTSHYFDGQILTETVRYLNAHGADLRSP